MVKRLVSSGPADHVHTSAEVVNCFVVPGLFGNKGKLSFLLPERNEQVSNPRFLYCCKDHSKGGSKIRQIQDILRREILSVAHIITFREKRISV